ncbi:MAG: oligosaccharide flippase family protein [Psychrilyobacter sp.]|uniref:oligosaccharide flippase family protein n=1 Tax=Psychrilyobacter sp. TaxID=2586924 RepID=UPI003C783280
MEKSLAKNFMYRIILMFYKIVVPILVIPYVYRIFSPTSMGQIEFSNSITNYFVIFAGFGVYTYGLREISRVQDEEENKKKMFTELFTISVISVLVVLSIYLGFVFFKFPSGLLKNFLWINSITIFSFIFYIDWINESFEDYRFITKKNIIIKTISIGFIFLIVKNPEDIYNYFIILVLTNLINNLWSFIYIKKYIKFNFKNLEFKKYLLPLGMMLIISNVNILYTQLDKVSLGFYSNVKETAYYGIGQKILNIIQMFIMSIIAVSIPRLSYYLGKNKEAYLKLLNKIISYMSFLMFPMSVGIVLLSREITIFFGGLNYAIAYITVAVFGIRLIFVGIESILSSQVMFLNGKEKQMIMIIGFAGVINFIMKVMLVNNIFGLEFTSYSAIFTTMLAEIIIIGLNLIYIKRNLDYKIELFTFGNLKYGFISLLFIPVVLLVKSFELYYIYNIVMIPIFCGIVYLIILILLKDKNLIEILNKVLPNKIKSKIKFMN